MATQELPPTEREEKQTKRQAKKAAAAAAAAEEHDDAADSSTYDELAGRSFTLRGMVQSFGSCGVSIAVHMVLFLLLAIFGFSNQKPDPPREIVSRVYEEQIPDEELNVELQQEIVTSAEMAADAVEASLSPGAPGGFGSPVSAPTMAPNLKERLDGPQIKVGPPTLHMPSSNFLIGAVPDGALGEERAVVDNYDQAMSRITQEVVWMLDKSDVLVVWCFDMSESMKDDQQEIRDRIYQVYDELGLTGKTRGGRLMTGVTSYGEQQFMITPKPTDNVEEIRAAIDMIKIDPSGEEMMCQAVGFSINQHAEYAKKTKRQMALILVTDESGNRDNNDAYLERAIAQARDAKCRIYALGREAAFGYPHARMRWVQPETNRTFWLLVDRGPETAFPEQLQTNGFHRRWDYFSSGFGPYEQARLAKETNGIFFMLPSVEVDAVHAVKRRYELEAMRSYKPDLRAKLEVLTDRDDKERFALRWFLWKVVSDLNPLESAEKARMLEMDMNFPLQPAAFVQQARQAQAKARAYLNYLYAAEQLLLENRRHREQEVSPRWQGNYDLMIAQLVAYQVRIYEYGTYLEYFMKHPLDIPPATRTTTNGTVLYLVDWNIAHRKKTFAEMSEEDGELDVPYPDKDKVLEYIDRSKQLFQFVIEEHPGTPWAERARYELDRGFGVHVVPDYDLPIKPATTVTPPPKL